MNANAATAPTKPTESKIPQKNVREHIRDIDQHDAATAPMKGDEPICERCGQQKSLEGGMGADVYICWPCTDKGTKPGQYRQLLTYIALGCIALLAACAPGWR